MTKNKSVVERSIRTGFLLALALAVLASAGCAPPAQGADRATGDGGVQGKANSAGSASIQVSFKLDPRLTSGVYMGERWVSPPTYEIVLDDYTNGVQAKAQVLDGTGRALANRPEWIPEDPDMVTVSPGESGAVTVNVLRVGDSNLHVRAPGVSKTLSIQAIAYQEGAIRVRISQ